MAYLDDTDAWQVEYINALADALLEIAKSGAPVLIKKGDTTIKFTSISQIKAEIKEYKTKQLYVNGCVERSC